jgi:hypothetical protein
MNELFTKKIVKIIKIVFFMYEFSQTHFKTDLHCCQVFLHFKYISSPISPNVSAVYEVLDAGQAKIKAIRSYLPLFLQAPKIWCRFCVGTSVATDLAKPEPEPPEWAAQA